jgi:hypothetical protein
MIALGEQHLQQCAALVVELRRAVLDHRAGLGFHGAGGTEAAIDLDRAQLAGAVRGEIRMPAQVRDVHAGRLGGLHDGLPGRAGDVFAVELESLGSVHASASLLRWAAASSRPVICRACDRAASRSKAGS